MSHRGSPCALLHSAKRARSGKACERSPVRNGNARMRSSHTHAHTRGIPESPVLAFDWGGGGTNNKGIISMIENLCRHIRGALS